jgi:dihydrofolate reductase
MQPINLALSIVVAMSPTRVIGKDNALPWRIPSDLTRFRNLTLGHPVIMGRKSWESIPQKFRPLPGRTNIVVTRQAGYEAPGAITVDSIGRACEEAARAPGAEAVFVIGGEDIYRQFLPFVRTVCITTVHAEVEGDTFFPELGNEWSHTPAVKQWRWRKEDQHETSFHIYQRK